MCGLEFGDGMAMGPMAGGIPMGPMGTRVARVQLGPRFCVFGRELDDR